VRLFSDVSSRVDDPYFARALGLAEQGRGATAPNPLVGCVIVRDGAIAVSYTHLTLPTN
jgi:diaminohydroxyphosphoribosylaminopyrimidine deaminase/5-amino-6-(5-phosphoribosylamino)uracil reductase